MVVRLLLTEYKVDGGTRTMQTELTPLHYAAFNGQIEIAKMLVNEFKAEPNAKCLPGLTTPLHHAAITTDVEMARCLVTELGANPNESDLSGANAVHYAAQRARTEMLRVLADLGAKVDHPDNNGDTPLHWAMRDGAFYGEMADIVQILVKELRANVNLRNNAGDMVLHIAAKNNRVAVVRLLLQLDAHVNAGNNNGKTPLDLAKPFPWCAEVVTLLENHIALHNVNEKKG